MQIIKKIVSATSLCTSSDNEIIELFGCFTKKNPWSFKFDEFSAIIGSITKFSNELTRVLAEDQVFDDLEANLETKKRFIRPDVGLVAYILIDRYLRILKVMDYYENTAFIGVDILGSPKFKLRTELEAYGRDHSLFNQYIINQFIGYKTANGKGIKTLDLIELSNWNFYEGFHGEINSFNHAKVTNVGEHKQHDKNKILCLRAVYVTPQIALNFKNFVITEEVMSVSEGGELVYNIKLREALKKRVSSVMVALVNVCINESGYKPSMKLTERFIDLFFEIYPVVALEGAFTFYPIALSKIKVLSPVAYLDGFLSASFEEAPYLNAACNFLGIPTYGMQHSGRGGYIANCPLVNEYSMNCCDYYISSGWKHIENHLPFPKNGVIPLPSINFSLKKGTHQYKGGKNVLLCLGEIFQYPVIYDASYVVDMHYDWQNYILKLVESLVSHGNRVMVRSYCKLSYSVHYSLIEKLKEYNSNDVIISDDFRKGVAREYFDAADVVVWDMLSGGFIESVLYKIPTIAIGSSDLVKFQGPFSELKEQMVREKMIANDVLECVSFVQNALEESCFYNEKRNFVISKFLKDYVWVSENWKDEWQNFFERVMHG